MMEKSDSQNTSLEQIIQLLREMQYFLEKDQNQKLIPGKHIQITETELGLLIEAETQELPDSLKQWILEMDQKIQTPLPICGENGITAEWDGAAYHLSLSQPVFHQYIRQTPNTPASLPQSSVSMPFQVSCMGYNPDADLGETGWLIRIAGWNPEENRFFKNLVFAGIQAPFEVEECTITIPSDGWIYVQILYSSKNNLYSAEIKYAAKLPETKSGTYHVPLAQIIINDQNEAEIGQMHLGNIFVSGRIV